MKSYDFSKPGGLRVTQELLDRMQLSYTEALNALAKVGYISGKFIISDVVVTKTLVGGPAYDYDITDGWMYWDDTYGMVRVSAGSLSGVNPATDKAILTLTNYPDDLEFRDGSTPNVLLEYVAEISSVPIATPLTATIAAVDDIQPFGRERDWTGVSVGGVSAGSVDVDIEYKKETLTNTLLLRGDMYANNANVFAGLSTPTYTTMTTLPVGYRPAQTVYFLMGVEFSGSPALPIPDNGAGFYIRFLNAKLEPGGQLKVEWINFGGGSPEYGVAFTVSLPLD
jgi:hypothetical protein